MQIWIFLCSFFAHFLTALELPSYQARGQDFFFTSNCQFAVHCDCTASQYLKIIHNVSFTISRAKRIQNVNKLGSRPLKKVRPSWIIFQTVCNKRKKLFCYNKIELCSVEKWAFFNSYVYQNWPPKIMHDSPSKASAPKPIYAKLLRPVNQSWRGKRAEGWFSIFSRVKLETTHKPIFLGGNSTNLAWRNELHFRIKRVH